MGGSGNGAAWKPRASALAASGPGDRSRVRG